MAAPTVPIQPIVIGGPAMVTFTSASSNVSKIYTKKSVTMRPVVETFNVDSAFGGEQGERVKATVWEIEIDEPVGQIPGTIGNLGWLYPNTPATHGASVLGGTLVVQQINNGSAALIYTFANAGITKPSDFFFSPLKTVFGPMTFTAICQPATDIATSSAIFTPSTGAFADTSYTGVQPTSWAVATLNAGTPFGSHTGFQVTFGLKTKKLESADVGYSDIIQTGVSLGVKCAPSSLTVAAIEAYCLTQATGAKRPGTPIGGLASATTALKLENNSFQATMQGLGVKNYTAKFEAGENLVQDLELVNAIQYVTGVGQSLIVFAAAS